MLKRITNEGMAVRPPTLKDVADRVGVSQATVSYVLNAKEQARIGPETRRRVLAAAAELQYRPNAIARAMAVGHSHTIGVYQPHIVEFPLSGMWAAQITRGIGDALHAYGYHMLVYGYRDSDEPCPSHFLDGRVDALIVLAPHTEDKLPQSLAEMGFAVAVIAGRPVQGERAVCIDVDNSLGGRLATEHLIRLGHTRIVHIAGPSDVPNAIDRANGYRAAMGAAGLAECSRIIPAGFSEANGFEGALESLELHPRPSALFVSNDVAALGALRACRQRGLGVPDDVSVIGYDDTPYAALASPPMTSVAQPALQLGRAAADAVVALRDGGPPVEPHQLLEPELIVRETCRELNSGPAARARR